MARRRIRSAHLAGAIIALAVLLAGCSGGNTSGADDGGNGDGPTRLTVVPGGDPNPERTDVSIVEESRDSTGQGAGESQVGAT
jgi:ABC-type glycerol-3-phosphate transport system substrate-binding protein